MADLPTQLFAELLNGVAERGGGWRAESLDKVSLERCSTAFAGSTWQAIRAYSRSRTSRTQTSTQHLKSGVMGKSALFMVTLSAAIEFAFAASDREKGKCAYVF